MTQFNEKQKQKFTILTLSTPVPNKNKSGFNSVIGSSITTTDFSFSKDIVLDRMYILNLRKFILIYINTKDTRIGVHYLIKTFNNHIKCKLQMMFFTKEMFFTLSTFNYLFIANKEHSYEYIFIFENLEWVDICAEFSVLSIDVSGGSNNKKYLLSPLQLRLSLFLSAVYGGSSASLEVTKSFHRDRTLETNVKGVDFSSKKSQKKLIDFIKSNEIFKDRILNEPLLFKNINELFDSKTEENSEVGSLIEFEQFEDSEKLSDFPPLP